MALGEWNVDGMLAAMPASLFSEWMAYDRLDPIGEARADARTALLASAVDNAGRSVVSTLAGKRLKASRPSDFMPSYGERKKIRQTPKQIYQTFKDALVLGGHLNGN